MYVSRGPSKKLSRTLGISHAHESMRSWEPSVWRLCFCFLLIERGFPLTPFPLLEDRQTLLNIMFGLPGSQGHVRVRSMWWTFSFPQKAGTALSIPLKSLFPYASKAARSPTHLKCLLMAKVSCGRAVVKREGREWEGWTWRYCRGRGQQASSMRH